MADDTDPLDHIGWDLWRASQAWKKRFVERMVGRGHAWFAEARANLLHLISADGTRQSALVVKSQMTKQAVQQFLDELEQDGLVKRQPDPADARGRLVRFTPKGLKALADANIVKREIEMEYQALIGRDGLTQLKSALDKIAGASDDQIGTI